MNHILLCCNKQYLQYMYSLIDSIVRNTNSELLIHIFYNWNLNDINWDKYKNTHIWLKIHILESDTGSNLVQISYLWSASYFRLFALQKLAQFWIKRILYLDIDMIVISNIDDIFLINVDKCVFAWCYENSPTINTGMMLVNCEKRLGGNYTQKNISYIQLNPEKITAADQTAINNVISKEDIMILDPIYNMTLQYWFTPLSSPYTHNQIKNYINQAKIVHFNGKKKARHFFCLHPLSFYYETYTHNPNFFRKMINFIYSHVLYMIAQIWLLRAIRSNKYIQKFIISMAAWTK